MLAVNCYLEHACHCSRQNEETGKIFSSPFDMYRLCKGFLSAADWLEGQSTHRKRKDHCLKLLFVWFGDLMG